MHKGRPSSPRTTFPPRPIGLGLTQTAAAAPPDELSAGSRLLAGGAAACRVATSPPLSHSQTRVRFKDPLHPSAWRQRTLQPAAGAAAAPRGGAVASSSPAAGRPEGRGDGARLGPRRSRCGTTTHLLSISPFDLVVLARRFVEQEAGCLVGLQTSWTVDAKYYSVRGRC